VDAGVVPKLLRQLAIAHVHGYDVARASLEQAIGKASGRRPKVQAATFAHIEVEGVEGSSELHSTARNEGVRRRTQTYVHIVRNERACLVDHGTVDGDVARQQDCLGSRARRSETSGDEKLIDAYFRHGLGYRH
jgi:hypothetical protein